MALRQARNIDPSGYSGQEAKFATKQFLDGRESLTAIELGVTVLTIALVMGIRCFP